LFQAVEGSDVGDLSLGSPINTSALLIILLHQVIESNTLVRLAVTLKACFNQRGVKKCASMTSVFVVDVDPRAGVGAQRCLLLWLRAAHQRLL